MKANDRPCCRVDNCRQAPVSCIFVQPLRCGLEVKIAAPNTVLSHRRAQRPQPHVLVVAARDASIPPGRQCFLGFVLKPRVRAHPMPGLLFCGPTGKICVQKGLLSGFGTRVAREVATQGLIPSFDAIQKSAPQIVHDLPSEYSPIVVLVGQVPVVVRTSARLHGNTFLQPYLLAGLSQRRTFWETFNGCAKKTDSELQLRL